MAGEGDKTRRIVLLGKTGSGKSSLVNTLFGEDTFTESSSANSETLNCQSETKTVNRRSIQLVDTPGLFDTGLNEDELKSRILRCMIECAPGAHAFLLVFSVGRFSPQEEEVVNRIVNEYFGEEALKYTTVVFTHGDDIKDGQKIEEWAKQNKALKNLLENCGGRCHVIDNKYWNNNQDPYRNNQYQIEELLKTIDQTVKDNKGGYYTNETLQMVQKKTEEKKAQTRQSNPNIPDEMCRKIAMEAVYNELMRKIKYIAVGPLLGAFLGGLAGAVVAYYFCASCSVVAVGAAVGAVGGAMVSKLKDQRTKYGKHH